MSTPTRRPILIPIKPVSAPAADSSGACGHDHEHDHGSAHGHHHAHRHADGDCCAPDLSVSAGAASTTPLPTSAPPGTSAIRWRIDQMDCPTEERLIRQKLGSMSGVERLDFNLLQRELTAHHRLDDASGLEAALQQIGMAPRRLQADEPVLPAPVAVPVRTRWLLAGSGTAAVAAEAVAWVTQDEISWPVMSLAALSIALAGGPTLKKGWIALRHLTLNIHFLMTLAVGGALVIGQWAEAAMVLFLFAVAEAIEALSLERARKAVQALSALAPDVAWVKQGSAWVSQPVAAVPVGALIRVRPGERVPLDAVVISGQAAVNESALTGESLPQDKTTGDRLLAGSVLEDGSIEARSTEAAGRSTLARMAEAIQAAQSQRAPTQRFVDEFARFYTPVVVLIAVLIAVLGPWISGSDWHEWLYEALVLLVIACPCALVVSTPVTVVSGLAAGARQGILVKGGAHLEAGQKLRAMALDKTGTLTQGRPALTDCEPLGRWGTAEALRVAASLDEHSSHPVARAVVNGWRSGAGPEAQLLPVSDFQLLSGRGVSGLIDGHRWWLGNPRLMAEQGMQHDDAMAHLQALEQQGKTAFVLFNESEAVAVLGVADTVREHAREALVALRSLGVHTVMLSGDNPVSVGHVGRQLGLADARGGLLPQDKLDAIAALKASHGSVAMVGDGVNDAPAMARSDVGLAMGAAGTATALETADVAIMDDDLRKLPAYIRLSRETANVLWQNIVLALSIKAVFFVLAFTGQATLWMAVFADMGASLLVVFNGLRLLRWKP
ncbi:heavy metal translocating P-type ATPase [Aquabacterium sp. UBA2148]|uniref:heavy metal translocating P-type ATPase n=1 Tax=Aquabacterium sp. UBA2148 TaxID=1946042 RepID=UPI00257F10EA|nr:heavy metal translocating P-type ATPase [Aquabacterium sp. UBA2148]